MSQLFDLFAGESFPLEPGLPADYRGFILQGSIASFCQSPSGLMVLQNYERSEFTIQLRVCNFFHLVRCILTPPVFSTVSLLALKNDFKATKKDSGKFTIAEGQFTFLRYDQQDLIADFKAGKEYHLIEISYSPEMLKQAFPHFETLREKFENRLETGSGSLITFPRAAGEKAVALIYDLLKTPFTPKENENDFEFKVREFFLMLLVESTGQVTPKLQLTAEEEGRLRELAVRLKTDLKGKYPIARLAREMGMNEMKLKMALKQLFGEGIFEYHTAHRMEEALRLFKESGLPTKKIATMLGYELTTSLITRFREYYGFVPSNIQKKF